MSHSLPVTESLALLDGVDGWLTDDQARRLHAAATSVAAGGSIVEIGSFRGRSTIVLASGSGPDVSVTAIDPHAGNDRGPQEISGFEAEAATDNSVFESNLTTAGVRDRVQHLRMFSDAAHGSVDGDIDVLYVDGAHRFGPARDDVRDWGRRVKPGGTMLVHDSFSSIGVTLALLAAVAGRGEWRYVGRSGSLVEYRRDAQARAASVAAHARQLPWFARNVAVKVLIVAKLGRLTRFLGHDQATWPY